MSSVARSYLIIGIIFLSFSVMNSLSTVTVTPSLQRAEILSSLSSVCLILAAFLTSEFKTKKPSNIIKQGKQGFYMIKNLDEALANELEWGSNLLLTATAAGTILIYWNGVVILRRGILGEGNFTPGETCMAVKKKGKLTSLVNTKLFPALKEFDPILEGLPSIMVYPLKEKGFLIVGGCSERCFSKSDEKWVVGWSDKIYKLLK